LYREDARFNSKVAEGCFHFLDERFLDLGFGIDNLPDQSFAEAADPLPDHIAGIGDLDDQHGASENLSTLSAVVIKNLLEV
jgi:hypothetical protein